MTDRIDLDERDEPDDEQADRPNPGDWLWRESGDPDAEPAPPAPEEGADRGGDGGDATTDTGDDATTDGPGERAVPHVPRANKDRPVGIPVQGGGAGGGSRDEEPRRGASTTGAASGPHGGDADDMTVALTYRAVRRLADPAHVVADAKSWADWVGIVGDVEAHVITKFQRDHHVDVDFFNGSGTGPGERLADVGPHSMFFADRMVVVGVEGEDEAVAREADWEFVSLSTAAEKADWALAE